MARFPTQRSGLSNTRTNPSPSPGARPQAPQPRRTRPLHPQPRPGIRTPVRTPLPAAASRALSRIAPRFIPGIGWALLAWEVYQLLNDGPWPAMDPFGYPGWSITTNTDCGPPVGSKYGKFTWTGTGAVCGVPYAIGTPNLNQYTVTPVSGGTRYSFGTWRVEPTEIIPGTWRGPRARVYEYFAPTGQPAPVPRPLQPVVVLPPVPYLPGDPFTHPPSQFKPDLNAPPVRGPRPVPNPWRDPIEQPRRGPIPLPPPRARPPRRPRPGIPLPPPLERFDPFKIPNYEKPWPPTIRFPWFSFPLMPFPVYQPVVLPRPRPSTRPRPGGDPYNRPGLRPRPRPGRGGRGIDVGNRPIPGVTPRTPVAPRVAPLPGVKERKLQGSLSSVLHMMRAIGYGATEFFDFVEALYKALPKAVRRQYGRSRKGQIAAVWREFDQIDWQKAVTNLATNELEDRLIGGSNRLATGFANQHNIRGISQATSGMSRLSDP